MWVSEVIFIICLVVGLSHGNAHGGGDTIEILKNEDLDLNEFTLFCELGFMIREDPNKAHEDSKECAVTEPGEFNHDEDLPLLFTLIMMCTWGAFVRAMAKEFKITLPYTVLLLISGAILGGFSHIESICPSLNHYTAIARISPQIILYTFLPILIFESAFSISVHTFMKSFAQIFILAFPGMLLCTMCTAVVCHQFFREYHWTFLEACLFGCIISATDPVAVVAILKDLGVSEKLGVIIDGESLMNDGVAILLFEIFHYYMVHANDEEKEQYLGITAKVIRQFVQISIGGPIWGWITGKITIFMFGYIYNDAAVEISATICAAYLTYWSSEYVLKVSGVIAVVVLGLTLSAERTVISPESEEPVHHFWEMLGYLANTVLFVLVGIVISETAINELDITTDLAYLILLYIALHVTRFAMLLLFYPILKRLGYGMSWQNLVVIMWGGLRGAVGICLALQIYHDEILCTNKDKQKLGAKILIHTAGIVVLTLLINGTTTKALLKLLKLTEVTVGQKEEMHNAVKRLKLTKWGLMRSMQMSRQMMGANWEEVDQVCRVENPYEEHEKNEVVNSSTLQPPRPVKDNTTVCWHCSNIVENEPTIRDYQEMTNDARERAIKSMKLHYAHMFDNGTLTELATQHLLANAEQVEDKYLHIIQARDFHKYMIAHGAYLWLRDKFIVKFGLHKDESLPDPPSAKWRQTIYWMIYGDWFEWLCFVVIVFNTITIVWDVIIVYTSLYPDQPCDWTPSEAHTKKGLHYGNYVFTTFYTVETILRIMGNTFRAYICSIWHYIDIIVLVVAYTDLYFGQIASNRDLCLESDFLQFKELFSFIRLLRTLQFARVLRLLRPLVPQFLRKLRREINFQMFVGYDMGKGFVETSDAVIKFIPQIAENKKVQQILRAALKRERNACVRDLALIHSKFPGVAVALKTRHACRAALNQMQLALVEIRDGGMLDDPEYDLLKRIIEDKMRQLQHSPTHISPTKPLSIDQGFHIDDDKKSVMSHDKLPPV